MGFADYVTKLSKNDEWYTPAHAVEILLPYIPKDAVVWCPFDTNESQYVKVLSGGGIKVIHSHIWEGKDFFTYQPEEHYDMIVSNPPYSMKEKVYKRCFELGKPFAMLVGMNGLFDSKGRRNMFSKYGIQILVPDGRTKFISIEDKKLVAPPFQAVYVCHKFLPETICYENYPVKDGNDLWGGV